MAVGATPKPEIKLQSKTTEQVASSLKNMLSNVGRNQVKVNNQMNKIADQDETKIADLLALQQEIGELNMHVDCASAIISASKQACNTVCQKLDR